MEASQNTEILEDLTVESDTPAQSNTDEKPVHDITIRFEGPRDYEAEDYIYGYEKMRNKIQEYYPTLQFRQVEISRMCDGCYTNIHRRQKGLDFKCKSCGIRFDLCVSCQNGDGIDVNICPKGWGCKYDKDNNGGWVGNMNNHHLV